MASQYFRDGRRKQRFPYRPEEDDGESFASHNDETGRYPRKEFPADSYYTRSDTYHQYLGAEEPESNVNANRKDDELRNRRQ